VTDKCLRKDSITNYHDAPTVWDNCKLVDDEWKISDLFPALSLVFPVE
jgi:hypothetical protein